MVKTRRSSLEVQLDRIAKLKRLEKQRDALKKDAEDTESPVHWAAIKAVGLIAAAIKRLVTLIRATRKHGMTGR